MAEPLKVIDLDQQQIIFAALRLQGFGDGDAATLQFSGPAYHYKKGSDGQGVRSKNFDRSALLTVRLMQGVSVHDLLSAIYNADYKSSNGKGVAGVMIKDGQGTTLLTGTGAYIEAPPDVTIAAEPGVREWKIRIDDVGGVWGSN